MTFISSLHLNHRYHPSKFLSIQAVFRVNIFLMVNITQNQTDVTAVKTMKLQAMLPEVLFSLQNIALQKLKEAMLQIKDLFNTTAPDSSSTYHK